METTVRQAPRCLPLHSIGDAEAGGKAQGLARLIALGLRVPPGFVVHGASPGSLPDTLFYSYSEIGAGRVAVRSSAQGEDALDASFAGQYCTLLDVEGPDKLTQAVERCLSSLDSERAVLYRRKQTRLDDIAMSVVVQRMVDAVAAGVVFTADPVSGRRNCLIVDAVPGRGEQLVSGEVTPDHYVLSRSGEVLSRQLRGATAVLTADHLRQLAAGALLVEGDQAWAMDLEWALGKDGLIYWLQARPVTRLGADPNELDTMQSPGDIYTSCNIGECMPGAITPLTFSTVWHADDQALQIMHLRCGAARELVDGFVCSRLYYGRMFLNLTTIGRTATHILGSTTDRLALALCGRLIPELDAGPDAPALKRFVNGMRFGAYLLSGGRHRKRLEKLAAELEFPRENDAATMYEAIDRRLEAMYQGFDHHMTSSAGAGALEPTLMEILAKGRSVTESHHARVAALLAGASDQSTESSDIVNGVHRLVERLREHPEAQTRFAATSPAEALAWISDAAASGAAAAEFSAYLGRHGHRSIRELELRQPEWSADPLPLVASVQAAFKARALGDAGAAATSSLEASRAAYRGEGPLLRALVRLTQQAVQRRERTKSLLVLVVARFKGAYRHLGELLAAEGRLADADCVFFLTHQELGRLVREAGDRRDAHDGRGARRGAGRNGGGARPKDAEPGTAPVGARPAGAEHLAATALARREILGYQMDLSFPDVFTGSPEPLDVVQLPQSYDHTLRGKPVSRGQVRGLARVVNTLEDAGTIQPGEILIAPVTDVGWSPYFSLVAGLATDVGSSVSHGAVVAREYGLPAVVDLRQATKVFKTGDLVLLDGDHGILKLEGEEHS